MRNGIKPDYPKPNAAYVSARNSVQFEGLDILTLLKEKHVVFDVKCTLDRNLVDGRL